jgi:hypothetical protein
MLESELMVRLRIEQRVKPLQEDQLLFLQMIDRLQKQLLSDFLKPTPSAIPATLPQNFKSEVAQKMGRRFNDGMLIGEKVREFGVVLRAQEREDDLLLECMVCHELIKKSDQIVHLMFILVVIQVRALLADFAGNPVLQIAYPNQDAKVLLMQDASQRRQAGHFLSFLLTPPAALS